MANLFVDTEVFLRYLTNDDPATSKRAETLFRDALRGKVKLATSLLVIDFTPFARDRRNCHSTLDLDCRGFRRRCQFVGERHLLSISSGRIDRHSHGGMSILDPESAINPFEVLLHSPWTDAEDRADLRVCFALRDPTQDLRFPRTQAKVIQRSFRGNSLRLIQDEETVLSLSYEADGQSAIRS